MKQPLKLVYSAVGIIAFLITIVLTSILIKYLTSNDGKEEANLLRKSTAYSESRTQGDNESGALASDTRDTAICTLNTEGARNSLGLNLKVYYPCSWKKVDLNKNVPYLVAQYLSTVKDSLSLGISVSISESPITLTQKNINALRTKEVLAELSKQYGDFVSYAIKDVKGIKGDEVVAEAKSSAGVITYVINHLYYNEKIVTIVYMIIAEKGESNPIRFQSYKPFFEKLLNKTEFI